MANPELYGGWRRLGVVVVEPGVRALMRHEWSGQEHLPRSGGVLVACNHLSVADPVAVALYVYRAGRFPRFLGKDGVFRVPFVGRALLGAGQILVYRDTARAGEAFRDAVAAVREGSCVVVYPEATVTRDPRLWPMRGKTGVARIALETGAPVVPVASWGAQDLWPYHGRPRPFPRKTVRITAGPPVDLGEFAGRPRDRATYEAATEKVMRRITDLVAQLRGEPAPERRYDPGGRR